MFDLGKLFTTSKETLWETPNIIASTTETTLGAVGCDNMGRKISAFVAGCLPEDLQFLSGPLAAASATGVFLERAHNTASSTLPACKKVLWTTAHLAGAAVTGSLAVTLSGTSSERLLTAAATIIAFTAAKAAANIPATCQVAINGLTALGSGIVSGAKSLWSYNSVKAIATLGAVVAVAVVAKPFFDTPDAVTLGADVI